MKTAVIVFPGSNCDRDIAVALEQASGAKPAMVWHQETALPAGVDFVALPGGFSFGDYLRSGAIAAQSPIMAAVKAFADQGGPVIGVCNGFQLLIEAGLLPGALLRNKETRFVAKTVHVRVEVESLFTSRYEVGQVLRIPVAHHDGNYKADEATLDALEAEGRVAFRYVDAGGVPSDDANFNGSDRSIAGVLSSNKRVLGMMPHPERAISEALGSTDGLPLFKAAMSALAPA